MSYLHFNDYDEITDSMQATRLNGYLAGHGSQSVLLKEMASLALPIELQTHFARVVSTENLEVPPTSYLADNPLPRRRSLARASPAVISEISTRY